MSEPSHERYAVPVYDIGEFGDQQGGDLEPQLADESASESVLVKYAERTQGDPELNVTYTHSDGTDRFRFRITDQELRWCAYRGDAATALPVAVQHAVSAFGYGIQDVAVNRWFFEWMEGAYVFSQVDEMVNVLSDLAMVQHPVQDAGTELHKLSLLILARAALSDDEYWEAWDAEWHDPDAVVDEDGWGPLLGVEADTRLESVLQSEALEWGTTLRELTRQGETFLMVDFVVPNGIERFQFRVTGENQCVVQEPSGVRVPSVVVERLNSREYVVSNIESGNQKGVGVDLLEYAQEFCLDMRDRELVREKDVGTVRDLPEVAYTAVSVASLSVHAVVRDEAGTRQANAAAMEVLGEEVSGEELSGDAFETLMPVFLDALPHELGKEMGEYISGHPAFDNDVINGLK